MRKPLFILPLFFSISALSQAPSNDNCANALLIVTDSACVNGASQLTAQTLSGATSDGGAIASTCIAVNSQDVWYYFKSKSKNPTITLSGLGTNWAGGMKIQLLSGTCGSFTEVDCFNGTTLTPALTKPLTPGTTYYIRIYKTTTAAPTGANWGFTICVKDPLLDGGRMNEIFSRTILSPNGALNYPWEITYGPDDSLWITESRGYKVYKISSTTGVKRTVLDLSSTSTWFTAGSGPDTLYAQNMSTWISFGTPGKWPQGGFAGLALHPRLGDGSGHDYVYVSYVHRYLSGSSGGTTGCFFRNKLVRFTYNSSNGRLESPAVLCDTLPGSTDHNSQRIIIAPVGGTNYLFYAQGDMGAGQFENRDRAQKAQNKNSYEGKILRFNLETDGDAGANAWIPNDNPYSLTSAVWSIGMRNNQGFAYDPDLNILYGTSHGPYSDDELNIIEGFKNYGHPLVIGFANDGNYNGTLTQPSNTSITAGVPYTVNTGISTDPPIGNEVTQMNNINANALTNGAYKDPVFSAYSPNNASILNTWQTNPGNSGWQSEGWSGLGFYNNTVIPGWKKSLIAAGLKWGRLIKLKMGATGTTTLPNNLPGDTVTYFQSTNRYRDMAFGPNGKDIYIIMDNSSATSGPGIGNPITPACAGCVIKYTFLGYADVGGKSNIPASIDVSAGTANLCATGTPVTIDGSNNYLWVPITGPDGNIVAEIKANGQNLGLITSSFYVRNGAGNRTQGTTRYLNRNMTITPAVQPTNPVDIRLYFTKAEFDALDLDPLSGISAISDVKILKNSDPCSNAILSNTTLITPTNSGANLLQGANGYVLQASINSFSSFYFGSTNIILPLNLLTFTGSLQNNANALLNWETTDEVNTSHFIIERSIDGSNFSGIGQVKANGSTSTNDYTYTDNNIDALQVLIVYYRLKMVDNDGSSKYSKVISISLADITGGVTVAPNPVHNNTIVSIAASQNGKIQWSLIDNTGRVVLYDQLSVKKGVSNQLVIPMEKFSSGSYYIKLTGAGIDKRIKIQKL